MNDRRQEHAGAATPQHWRRRTNNHERNVADLLIECAKQGMCVQGAFMYERPELYGRSPRSRVSDLINLRGWDIGSKPGEHDCQCYWLRRDGEGNVYPQTQHFEPEKPSESPYMRRRREEDAAAMPLFTVQK